MNSSRRVVVFDCGSSSTRVGFSHDAVPTAVFPTLISTCDGDLLIGSEATNGIRKHVMDGLVLNWNYMEKIWRHAYTQLDVNPEEHPLVLNLPQYTPKGHTEKTTQIIFEELNVPALHLNYSQVLSLYSSGSLTGLVVESGYAETQFYPIYEGHILERTIHRGIAVAGNYLTYFLQDSLIKKGHKCDYDTANAIKEKSFYVSRDPSTEDATEETFTLPDGTTITLSQEKYLIPEQLYTTSIDARGGVHEFVAQSLYRCDPELRKDLFTNIVLSGGNTLLPGFAERLQDELTKMRFDWKWLPDVDPSVVAPANRPNSVWIGGTILASLSTFPDMCMTNEEYNEYGPTLAHRKFF